MNIIEDCYFFIDLTEEVQEQRISVLCLKCREDHYPNVGWFWEGSKSGYGPWTYKCSICQHIIHEGKKKNT